MPELPEVETTRRGIARVLPGRRIRRMVVRERRLRWPIESGLEALLSGQRAEAAERRAKYLLLRFERGTLLVHLGMSGSLRVLRPPLPVAGAHDHYDLELDDGTVLRYHDPRRFGCAIWIEGDPARHPLLADLGPEPFDAAFDGDHLYRLSRGRRAPVKNFLMDGHVVVGVGNIYASESLFMAGIDPRRAAGRVSRERYAGLARAVREILRESIERGGTTLRDYVNGSGEPGWFGLSLRVYGRPGEACPGCGTAVRHCVLGQRSSFFCPACQR